MSKQLTGEVAYTAWDVADDHLAILFGLNQSKYEWAIQEYYWQKRQADEQMKQAVQSSRSQVCTACSKFEVHKLERLSLVADCKLRDAGAAYWR